mmetsp:Transcript_1308/g.4080  ORF Transcript_1308/g.4080 Transcript_1308/m.4080 type:complete len:470 (+) Transcript_1308:76-1485(+)
MSRLSEPLIAAPPPPRGTLFAGNLLQYINDNVVMMAMACTVSALGNHIGACILADTVQAAAFGLACDCATVVLLRSLLLGAWARSEPDSQWQNALSHMLLSLPWIVRVPASLLVDAGTEALHRAVGSVGPTGNFRSREAAGAAFLTSLLLFLLLVHALLRLMRLNRSQPDSRYADQSARTYALRTATLACTSATGKAGHLLVRNVTEHFAGTRQLAITHTTREAARLAAAGAVEQVLLSLLAAWLLGWAVPLQHESPRVAHSESLQISLGVEEYIVGYVWSFSLANYLWLLCSRAGELPSPIWGAAAYWGLVLLGLVLAASLARTTPDQSFYDMGKGPEGGAHWLQGPAQLTCWYVDFTTWFGWSGLVLSFDLRLAGGPSRQCLPGTLPWVVALNFSMFGALLLVAGATNLLNAAGLERILPWTAAASKTRYDYLAARRGDAETKLRQSSYRRETSREGRGEQAMCPVQ